MSCSADAGIRTDTSNIDTYYFTPKKGLIRMDGFAIKQGVRQLTSDQILVSLETIKQGL
jgi:hypothetical protein